MNLVQADFNTRAAEVKRFRDFLREFDGSRVSFVALPSGVPALTRADQAALFKTLKANLFLLLYNLVESTLKNAIEAIFDEFKARTISFDHCRNEIRKIVLSNLRKHNVEKVLPNLSQISIDVMSASFRKDQLFAGNVDGRRIREVAAEYGFRNPIKKSDLLLTVKTSRNDLAHGNKSFDDVGRDYDLDRLSQITDEVLTFLDELLVNVGDYIRSRGYLAVSSP